MEVKCDYCGKIKDRKPSDLKGKKNHFCSMECFSKWLKATEARKGENNPKYGTEHSEETLEKIRTNVKEALAREEVREKLKNKKGHKAWNKGKNAFPLLDDKEWINNKYWTEEKNLDEIAEIVGCSRGAVWKALKRLKIERRTYQELALGNDYAKGLVLTETQKKQRSKIAKGLWKNPEYRENVCTQLPRSEQHYNWKGGSIEVKCENCEKVIERERFRLIYAKHQFCSPKCHGEWLRKTDAIKGENCPWWQGGISFEPYCPKFNEAFKESIREEFGRRCFLCPKTEEENGRKLSVHHVNYNKDCLCVDEKCEFVPLCISCHSKTNYNREYWENLIRAKIFMFSSKFKQREQACA